MTFTYTDTLSESRDKVRFYLQDTVLGEGPLPADGNFTDEELDGLITAEGIWQRAVAAGLETLANAWRRYPSFSADGLKLDRSDIADGYAKQAKEWRDTYGESSAALTSRAGSRAVTRVDGYSDDVDSHEV
jgi:hypothetical protein